MFGSGQKWAGAGVGRRIIKRNWNKERKGQGSMRASDEETDPCWKELSARRKVLNWGNAELIIFKPLMLEPNVALSFFTRLFSKSWHYLDNPPARSVFYYLRTSVYSRFAFSHKEVFLEESTKAQISQWKLKEGSTLKSCVAVYFSVI